MYYLSITTIIYINVSHNHCISYCKYNPNYSHTWICVLLFSNGISNKLFLTRQRYCQPLTESFTDSENRDYSFSSVLCFGSRQRYSSVSDMLDELGWPPLSQRRQDLFCFTKLLTVWHKCPSKISLLRCIRALEENTILNLDILVKTSQYGQSFPPKSINAWNGFVVAKVMSLAVF